MSLRAGFAEIDITPTPETQKMGWLKVVVGQRVADPLFARVALFEAQGQQAGFIALDTLAVGAKDVRAIREGVEAAYGFPGSRVMVTATHNHAGPAILDLAESRRDEAYARRLITRLVTGFGQALEARRPAEIGFGAAVEFRVGFNRRVVQRDGTVKTHGNFEDPQALCLEGPIDPELAVIAARGSDGKLLGLLVNFACHPTHHGPDEFFSAGWPGQLAIQLKALGCPCPLFINGAQGNISTNDPARGGADQEMEAVGARLAERVAGVLRSLVWRRELAIGGQHTTIDLPYRQPNEAEIRGTLRGAQRFVDPALYDRVIPELLAKIRERRVRKAEVQVLRLDEYACVGMPCELFVELGLQLKERAHPGRALVFGLANGMVGYVPTRAAFERGGYETTFLDSSCLAPDAGERLIQAGLGLLRSAQAGP